MMISQGGQVIGIGESRSVTVDRQSIEAEPAIKNEGPQASPTQRSNREVPDF